MNTISIKKDDLVVVLSGKDKGKQGKVLSVMPSERKVVVEERQRRLTKPQEAPPARASRAASSRRKPPSMPARCSASAPSATSPPAPPTSCWLTARRSASARSAALKSEREERITMARMPNSEDEVSGRGRSCSDAASSATSPPCRSPVWTRSLSTSAAPRLVRTPRSWTPSSPT